MLYCECLRDPSCPVESHARRSSRCVTWRVQHPDCSGPARPGSAQTERPGAVVTTPHFAFFSDLAANLNDALIAAGRARRFKRQVLFETGPEKACFDKLTAAERAGWTRAVDYFAEIVVPFSIDAREQILFWIELMAGVIGPRAAIGPSWRSPGASARRPCPLTNAAAGRAGHRRSSLDEHVVALLNVHERALGERLAQVYGTSWVGAPYRSTSWRTWGECPGVRAGWTAHPRLEFDAR
jgi:hypothetical protein